MRIIVDAMGGDNAPLAIVKGALQGQKRWGVDITLTGDEAAIRDALAQCGVNELPQGMDIVPTTEEVTMELTNGLSPIVLTPVDDKNDFAYMILPVRIKN